VADDFLERVWASREERVYPELFGKLGPGIFPLDRETFDVFKQEPDPRWLFTGVFESEPSSKHPGWIYVSSGLSNPWEQDGPVESSAEPSWLGVEFLLRMTEQGAWAIRIVQRIAAFEILLAHERFPGRDRLSFGDRIPLGGPMVPQSQSLLTHLLVAPPADDRKLFQLESGCVDFIQLVGITEREAAFGRENGLDPLLVLLRSGGAYEVTDPTRPSLV
jgi:hypothetical protein